MSEGPARRILAVVGPGEGAALEDIAAAERIAELAARGGWLISCGGRDAGVMGAAARGAARGGGLSIGVLPGPAGQSGAPELSVALTTGLGEARNVILAESCTAMVACGMNPGTAAELALALRAGKPVILIRPDPVTRDFYLQLSPARIRVVSSADEACALLTTSSSP